MDLKKVLDVPYYTQRDNQFAPMVSCYPTSMGMAIAYCLKLIGKNKKAIGCPHDMQIEDYINIITMSDDTRQWIRNNVSRFGSWMLRFKPRTIACVEEMIFNKLMNVYGFGCKFHTQVSFDQYCSMISRQQLPQILHGNFRPETRVGGHIICGIGFNKDEMKLIVNDPFGDAARAYRDRNGERIEYRFNHWFIKNDKKRTMWVTTIFHK